MLKINKDNKVISAVTEEKAHKKNKTPDNSPQKKEEKVNKQLQNFSKYNVLKELKTEIQNSL